MPHSTPYTQEEAQKMAEIIGKVFRLKTNRLIPVMDGEIIKEK